MSTFEETEASPMQVDPAVVSQTTLEDLQKHLQQANSQNEVLRLHISSLEEEVNNLREERWEMYQSKEGQNYERRTNENYVSLAWMELPEF